MNNKNGAYVPTGSACLKKAQTLLLVLQPAGADLVLLMMLEVLLWTA